LWLTACLGDVTGSRTPVRKLDGYTLPEVTGTACQYGGEYPVCDDPPPSGDGGTYDGGMDPGTEPPPTGGGSSPDSTATCDPTIHPDCEQPLTAADTTTIQKALRDMLRPASQFTDSLALKDCQQMEQWFRDALAANQVFRGKFDSDSTNDANGEHYGLYDPNTGHIHFDPSGLDGANAGNSTDLREIAITALHEGSHAGGYNHPGGPTFDSQGRDYYTDTPFNRLNPGANSCIPR
jgi:hypothetical protein